MKLIANHPAARLDLTTEAAPEADGIRIVFSGAGTAFLVIHATMPLVLGASAPSGAALVPGWDGTLGYSHYGLRVSADGPGTMRVPLHEVPPPPAIVADEPGELDRFREGFARRASRFPESPAALGAWQDAWRAKLRGWLLGEHMPVSTGTNARLLGEETRAGLPLQRYAYASASGYDSTFLFCNPGDTAEKKPLLVCLHGHEATWGDADAGAFEPGHNDDFCHYFATHGWAVLQPATMDHRLRIAGGTLQGQWMLDAESALDWAITQPGVDPRRVAVCGLSAGAHIAMGLLALDRRIAAGVVGCILSTWHHVRTRFRIPPHCDCGISGQLGDRIEQCDWAALAAPTPVQFQHGRQDACFCPDGFESCLNLEWNTGLLPAAEFETLFDEVRRAWRTAGHPSNVNLHIHGGRHSVDSAAALAWLERHVGPARR